MQAKEQGVDLIGQIGLLDPLTTTCSNQRWMQEMTEHLGYDNHDTGRS